MIRRWLPPVIFGLVLMLVAGHVMTVRMPRLLMVGIVLRRRVAQDGRAIFIGSPMRA